MSNEQKPRGQRRTQDPCPNCFMNRTMCLCEFITRLDLPTRVSLVIHSREMRHTTNTGRLALSMLVNSTLRIRGEDHHDHALIDLSDLKSEQYHTVLFYPSPDAVELTRAYVAGLSKPIQLIVPDGNWRQASRIHYRQKELADLPRVMIREVNTGRQHLRAESTEYGMSTLEAISKALRIIEGDEVGDKLLELYTMKLKRTLESRGVRYLD